MSVQQAERLVNAQVAVLGSMLIDADCIGPVLAQTDERDFPVEIYRTVYRAIKSLFREALPVDAVTVRDRLRQISGSDYGETLAQLMDATPTAANADAYVEILRKDATLWHLQQLGQAMAEAGDYETAMTALDRANAAVIEKAGTSVWTMAEGWKDFVERHQEGQKPAYLDWIWPELNERVRVGAGSYSIIGGYASDGKSCLALAFALRMAATKRVGFFSLEMSREDVTDRLLVAKSLVGMGDVRNNKLDEKAWEELAYAADSVAKSNLQYLEAAGMTVSDIQAVALARHYDVIIVDYLQLIEPERGQRADRVEQVAEISRSLQKLARKCGIAVIALSQLTPGPDAKKKAPSYYDLRDSKQQTMDTDVILLIYKEVFEAKHSARILTIAKNRHGEAGASLRLRFDGPTQTFTRSLSQPKQQKPQKEQITFSELDAAKEHDLPF